LLVPALAFLGWWGWSGNFAVSAPSLFTLDDQEAYYTLQVGVTSMGFAHRLVKVDPVTERTTVSERSALNLSFSGLTVKIRSDSETVFDRDGRLVSAAFSLPLGNFGGTATAMATATVDGQTIRCRLRVGDQTHEAQAPMPAAGPVLVSGLIPWLSHQRNVPMGRPIGLSLLDPVSMAFNPAELIIEDATDMSDELQVFRLTLRFMGNESLEWVNAQGNLLRQYNPGLEIDLYAIGEDQYGATEAELAKAMAEDDAPLDGPLAGLIGGFLSGDGLDVLGKALMKGGEASRWELVTEGEPPAAGAATGEGEPQSPAPGPGGPG
jgi:hypothetical protein